MIIDQHYKAVIIGLWRQGNDSIKIRRELKLDSWEVDKVITAYTKSPQYLKTIIASDLIITIQNNGSRKENTRAED